MARSRGSATWSNVAKHYVIFFTKKEALHCYRAEIAFNPKSESGATSCCVRALRLLDIMEKLLPCDLKNLK